MQIEKVLINNYVFQKYPENFPFQLYLEFCRNLPVKFAVFLKSSLHFNFTAQ